MVFNATFNNISVILWHLVLLVEETRLPRENHQQTLSHNVVSIAHPVGLELTTLVVICTDCIGSCISNHINDAIYLQLISTEIINQLKDELRFKTI
jgi:hypothetical protein